MSLIATILELTRVSAARPLTIKSKTISKVSDIRSPKPESIVAKRVPPVDNMDEKPKRSKASMSRVKHSSSGAITELIHSLNQHLPLQEGESYDMLDPETSRSVGVSCNSSILLGS
eukprot:5207571-Amphidinium_carterae.1